MEAYRELAGALASMAQEGDALIVQPPGQVAVIGPHYEAHVSVYPLPDVDSLEEGLAVQKLQDAMAGHTRIFSVFVHRDQVDPQHSIEQWLNKHVSRAWEAWYGAVQLVLYGTLWEGDSPALERSVSASWAEQISLEGYRLLDDTVEAGDILRITWHWRALSRIDEDYKVFIHQMDEDGNLVAQRDSQPLVGARPMTSWVEGEESQDKYGILASDAVPAGHYSLIMGIYSASTGDRLMLSKYEDGAVLGDAISLTSVTVINEQS